MLRVTEIYRSIQGEGTCVGRPCTFIRLTGCNLRCSWCDTAYAFHGGQEMTTADILREVEGLGEGLVLVTGGEPLAQPECIDLLRELADAGHEVLLETGGSLEIGEVDSRVRRIVDIKCPGSGEHLRNLWSNMSRLTPRDEVKLVIRDRADFDWGLQSLERHGVLGRGSEVLWSPVHDVCDPSDLSQWILDSRAPGRLQLQLHKVVWPSSERGV